MLLCHKLLLSNRSIVQYREYNICASNKAKGLRFSASFGICLCMCNNNCIVAVDFVCDDPAIRAISFVGSDRVGKYIYERGSANGKRVQSNMVC